MANALAATRLSHKTDESTSIERQREQTYHTAKARGDTLVHTTEDEDVSGAVSPFLREGLGPWLTEPAKVAQWDVLIVAKLDRLTRSLSDFDDMVKWLDAHGKTLVSVSESLDLSSSTGRMFAGILAMFAQFERERMSERRKEAAVKIKSNGWWAGFGHPYGTRPVKKGDHWELEIDPDDYARLDYIADEILGGISASAVARELTAKGIPTPANGKTGWRQNTIRDMFANPKCVLDPGKLALVRDALDTSKQNWTRRGADGTMLLDVAYCQCGAKLYSKRYTSKGKQYEYYDCSAHCGARRIPMADLEAEVSEHMEYLTGPVYRKVIIPAKSAKGDLMKIDRKLRSLDFDAPDFAERQAELLAERNRLREAGSRPQRTDLEDTDIDAGAYWKTLPRHQRRLFLLNAGIRAVGCRRTPDGRVIAEITSAVHEYLAV